MINYLKMSVNKNIFTILDNYDLSEDELESDINNASKPNKTLKKRKQFRGKNKVYKYNNSDKHYKPNQKVFNPVYNEMDDLPLNFADAIEKKQNLTLKQILVLMELQAIPGLVLNTIHDKLQLKVKRRQIKISHDSRVFYVSCYNWYDLGIIEKMIDSMLFSC